MYNNTTGVQRVINAQDLYRSGRVEYVYFSFTKSILCLENDLSYVLPEKEYCEEMGINYFQFPLSGIRRPKVGQLLSIVELIQNAPKPLLVRCRRGIDRTGYAIAAYREKVMGWDVETAYNECLKYGHRRWLYWWWKRSLEELTVV